MAGAISVSGSFTESTSCPWVCLDSVPSCRLGAKSKGKLGLRMGGRRQRRKLVRSDDLGIPFLDARYEWRRLSIELLSRGSYGCSRRQSKFQNLRIVAELGGQYEETFNDVKLQIRNYFTHKAVRTVLYQLYEMNPPQYTWFYSFITRNDPSDGTRFIQSLVKERRELAERVMITRLHLYGKWIKICNHAEIYKEISDENLKLMRERLMETVIWPSDDANGEKTE